MSINYNPHNKSHFLLLQDYFPAVANWLKLRSYICMSARQLVLRQRAELLGALCCGGSSEGLESVLDLLLSWGMLFWEDYQNVRVPGRALCANTRVLLDLVYTKGDETCQLLLAAFKQVLPEAQRAGLSFGNCRTADLENTRDDTKELHGTAIQTLQTDRPGLVRRLKDHIEGALEVLLHTGSFTPSDCDEVQLLVYTPSQQARRLLDQVRSKGEPAAKVLLQYFQQTEDHPSPFNQEAPPKECLSYQKKLRSTVSAQSHFLSTYGGTSSLSLEDIYTEGQLELAQGGSEAQPQTGALGLEDVVGLVGTLNQEADTVLVSGEAGSGKSTLLQRLHLLWARGAALHDFFLLFPFSCRRLSSEQRELSLRELLFLHCCWPDGDQDRIFQFILDHPHLILFTFDGLDEFMQSFSDSEQRHCCPTQCAPVPTLLFNLLQGSLMKGVRKVVTSRPEAVGPTLKRYLRKEVLLKGFSPGGIDCFVRKYLRDPTVATRVLESLRNNTALLGLCHIPVFCWIVSKCYKELLGCGEGEGSPQTITDVYLMILQHFFQRRASQRNTMGIGWVQEHQDTALHLGQLAMEGLGASCYVFTGTELQKCGVTEEDICMGFLIRSEDLSSSTNCKHYEFLHITMQCFFAALYIVLNNNLDRSTIPKLFQPQDRQQQPGFHRVCLGHCLTQQEGALKEANTAAETPNLQITATFVSGLLSQRHRSLLLLSCPGPTLDRKSKQVVTCLSKGIQKHFKSIPRPVEGEKKSMHAMPGFVWLIKCIHEMQDSRIARDTMAKLEVEHLKLTYCNIGPVECTALAYVLQHLRNPVGLQLDYNYVGDVGVEQLLPCLHVCHSVYLRHNNISDEGIRKLIEKGIQCERFQKIALFNNKLTDACTECFAHLLKTKQNFLSLRLGNNNITAAGAGQLAEGLRFNRSLQFLGLWGNKIGDKGAEAIANALKDSQTLVWLRLTKNCITRTGVECLILALEGNTSVKAVWLRGNELSPEEVEEMTQREPRLTF
ncbi:nucleotide-binding oligomerization domain-containing protein 2 isoform X2 [Salvelinus namaycush]|uniref:Nucleotide-binding oligomerization domain-containing protein 2 isoform X2 n=1 Tax=Salvelinus namaycush TaxID=8040 RepID=A0A8U0UEA7_SALNM|nr:nucleotide-binding oligomerization domain-containing protein 2 isoform X2 [Salvelinus namaycush]